MVRRDADQSAGLRRARHGASALLRHGQDTAVGRNGRHPAPGATISNRPGDFRPVAESRNERRRHLSPKGYNCLLWASQQFALRINPPDEETSCRPSRNCTSTASRRRSTPTRTAPLLSVLRDDLDLTGSKYGCGEGRCGACTVLLDGRPARSCTTPVGATAGQADPHHRGAGSGDQLHPLQEAFLERTPCSAATAPPA